MRTWTIGTKFRGAAYPTAEERAVAHAHYGVTCAACSGSDRGGAQRLGWGLGWTDIVLFAIIYTVSLLGVTVGYHRYFAHGSFKAKRWLRVSLTVLGSTAMQGPLLHWAADHRRHYAFSDKEGDPRSPWLFGTSPVARARGFWHAHMGWLFNCDLSNPRRFVPELLADKAMVRVSKLFWLWTAIWLVLPGIIGGLVTWSGGPC